MVSNLEGIAMLSSEFIILSLLVGYISGHGAPVDPSCYDLKTSKRADDCCDIPGDIDEKIMDTCIDKLDPSYTEEEQLMCAAECIAQELGVMKNRTVDKEAARMMFVNSIGKDPNFSSIIGGAYDKCYERVAAIPEHANAKCNFAPAYLMNCINGELFKICPSAVWDASEGCVELKSKLEKGCPFSAIDD